VDVKALVRLSTLYDVPLACNPATANLLISSPQFDDLAIRSFEDRVSNWNDYLNREVSKT
jgi:methylglyoxal synthase